MSYPGGRYQGLGAFDAGPPKRRWRGTALAAGAVVVLAGGAVAFVALGGDDEPPPAPPTTSAAPVRQGVPVANRDAGITYSAPDGWEPARDGSPIDLPSMDGVEITATSSTGPYECGGADYSRGFAGSGTAQDGEINAVATKIANAVGKDAYDTASGVQVDVATPRRVTRTGDGGSQVNGVQVEATVHTSGDKCLSTEGFVVVTVLQLPGELAFVVANGDVSGGPTDPPPATRAAVTRIADSARPLA